MPPGLNVEREPTLLGVGVPRSSREVGVLPGFIKKMSARERVVMRAKGVRRFSGGLGGTGGGRGGREGLI